MGEPSDSITIDSNMEQENITTLPIFALVPCRSGRIVRESDRFMFLGEAFEAISENLESDPTSYEVARADSDSNHWVKAIKIELESMNSNQVWELVEPPANIKPIGCKWVYKRKRGSDGKEETFKARMVAKGLLRKRALIMRKPSRL